MRTSRIRFAPEILKRLGEELNPHPSAGIIELVKNSYDADSRKCVVTLEGVDNPGGLVEVQDDGDGMTIDQIEKGWLVLGHSPKQLRRRTRLGRVPAGSKGLGRLAALRLGRVAKLVTRPRSRPKETCRLVIDWKLFDDAPLIDDVALGIDILEREKDARKGTTITLDMLRQRIGRLETKRLARAMLLLADPFGDDKKGFQPRLVTPEFSDLEQLVERRYFDHASFHLVASLNKSGKASARLLDSNGEVLYHAKHDDLFPKNEDREFDCPPVQFELWTFLLNSATFSAAAVSVREVREWLAAFGGVHVYQNELRVAPYGDDENDWLAMNLSRARSPEERASTNNSIGRVRIDDPHETLLQKTDRSGFIESAGYFEIRRFAIAALDWMASRRLDIAERKRAGRRATAQKKTKRSKQLLDKTIDAAPAAIRTELQEAVERYDKSHQKEVDELKKEVQLYRTLSTAGITAATFAHESTGNPIKVIRTSLSTIERRAKSLIGADYSTRLKPPIERIRSSVESLHVVDNVTLSLLAHEKRRIVKVYIHDAIKDLLRMFRPFFIDRKVDANHDLALGSPWLHGTRAAIESIITNLVNNSLVAMEDTPSESRRLTIHTTIEEDILRLGVMDSGSGLKDIRATDIWLPGKTTRKDGTGLGLTIVKDTVLDLGGNVGFTSASNLGGLDVFVELPILGV